MRVMINGFGRIGRTVLRAWLRGGWPQIEIVAINDIAPAETCAYLLEYDSVFGPLDGGVEIDGGALVAGGRRFPLTRRADLSALDLAGVDLVLECTGKADDRDTAERGLRAGARRVLISGPSEAADVTLVLGANETLLSPRHRLVSNASCTTNALAPLVRVLDEALGISDGWMTTIHCYKGSQQTVDDPRSAEQARNSASLVDGTTVPIVTKPAAPAVAVVAMRAAWVRVSRADGTVLFEKILDGGESFQLPPGASDTSLRAGNSGAVYLSVDNVPYGPLGGDTSVAKNVTLSAEAIRAAYQPVKDKGALKQLESPRVITLNTSETGQ